MRRRSSSGPARSRSRSRSRSAGSCAGVGQHAERRAAARKKEHRPIESSIWMGAGRDGVRGHGKALALADRQQINRIGRTSASHVLASPAIHRLGSGTRQREDENEAHLAGHHGHHHHAHSHAPADFGRAFAIGIALNIASSRSRPPPGLPPIRWPCSPTPATISRTCSAWRSPGSARACPSGRRRGASPGASAARLDPRLAGQLAAAAGRARRYRLRQRSAGSPARRRRRAGR